MKHPFLHRDETTRRQFVESLAAGLLGVSLVPSGGAAAALAAPAAQRATAKARRVIYLFMEGGMSHLDTFDLKPDNKEVQGPVSPIKTSADGIQISEYLPLLARQMHHVALIRSLTHNLGAHEPGQYIIRTGFAHQTGITHPALGAWCTLLGTPLNAGLPPYVRIGDLANHPGCGFFDMKYSPLPISKAEDGLANSTLRAGMTQERFQRNLTLAEKLDASLLAQFPNKDVRAYGEIYANAVRTMTSSDLDAFDLTKEPEAVREAYGSDHAFGAGVLLARRLVERGVNFVEVDLGGWDTHLDNHKAVAARCAILDRPLARLIADLDASGLLDETLIVLATEFGRTPEIDEFKGRSHHPFAFSCLLIGGGIQGGQVIGKSDASGSRVTEQPVSILDFHATIATALGLDTTRLEAPFVGGQKFSIIGKDTAGKGKVIAGLL